MRGREALRELTQGWPTATRTVLRNVAITCVAGGEQARMPRGTGREKTHTHRIARAALPTWSCSWCVRFLSASRRCVLPVFDCACVCRPAAQNVVVSRFAPCVTLAKLMVYGLGTFVDASLVFEVADSSARSPGGKRRRRAPGPVGGIGCTRTSS